MPFPPPPTSTLILPTGAQVGPRIVLDGAGDTITGYDAGNNVTFQLSGDGGGTIHAGTITGVSISASTLTGSTIIGGTIETAVTDPRIVLDGSNPSAPYLLFYDSSGNNTGQIQGWASFGLNFTNPHTGGSINVDGGVVFLNSSLQVGGGIGSINAGQIRGSDCNHLVDVQSGTNSSLSLSAATSVSGFVVFPRGFASTPTVVCTVATAAGGSKGLTIRVSSVTTSGFQLTIDAPAATTLANIAVAWHAYTNN